ncbi:MAG: 50S ribosomal protein L29 [Minisyncoccia bacterium]
MAGKTGEELEKLLAATRADLRGERFAKAGSRPKNPNAARKFRATVARILTEQHARSVRGKTPLASGSATASASNGARAQKAK